MKAICSLCGDRRELTEAGVCVWRHGCEHRVLQREAALLREVEAIIEEAAVRERPPSSGNRLLDFWRHPSSQGRTNHWLDSWLYDEDSGPWSNDDHGDDYPPK